MAANSDPGYYSPMFSNFQQKQISGFVTSMWHVDPFKAKWSIVAKSYSMVRDIKGKDQAPLNGFLATNAPLMGIIEPAQYLQTMGWEIAIAEDGQAIMLRTDKSIDERCFMNNLSVNDLIRHSYHQGFFTGNLFDVLLPDNEAAMTMATSIQPTTGSQPTLVHHANDNDTGVAAQHDTKGSDGEGEALGMMDSVENSTGEVNPATNVNTAAHKIPHESGAHNASAATNIVDDKHNAESPSPSEATVAVIESPTFGDDYLGSTNFTTTDADTFNAQQRTEVSAKDPDVSTLSADNFHLQGQYPFNTEFDPDTPSFTYDPFTGNQFNVFDISDAGWADLINFNASA